MSHTAKPTNAKRPYRPARPRQLPDINNLPPLVRLADCWTNRSAGKYGLTPYSRKQLESLVKAGKARVVRLGPRSNCLDKETVLALNAGAFASAATTAAT